MVHGKRTPIRFQHVYAHELNGEVQGAHLDVVQVEGMAFGLRFMVWISTKWTCLLAPWHGGAV